MAAIVKEPSRALLAASRRHLRQGAATTRSPAHQRGSVGVFLRSLSLRVPSEDAHAPELLDRASMAIFKALILGPKALEIACQSCDASLIDMPLLDAAVDGDSRPPGSARHESTALAFTALQLCARHDMWREARILIAHGANPNLFNASVTAIGLAAYSGSARALCEMISFGANATLYLLPEHAPGTPSVHGSTLLHRVANRPIGENKKAILLILAHCAQSYPEPLPKTLDGMTPVDWADDEETRQTLLSVACEREARALGSATPASSKAGATLRM